MKKSDNTLNQESSFEVSKEGSSEKDLNFKKAVTMTAEDLIIDSEGYYVVPNGRTLDQWRNTVKRLGIKEPFEVRHDPNWVREDGAWVRKDLK